MYPWEYMYPRLATPGLGYKALIHYHFMFFFLRVVRGQGVHTLCVTCWIANDEEQGLRRNFDYAQL